MSDSPVIPDAAVEAALSALFPDASEVRGFTRAVQEPIVRTILEAAYPHLLSHEREETRLAHVDAVVNAGTVSKYEAMVERVEAVCATVENLSVPSAEPSWHISGEKSAVAKVRAALEETT